MTYSKSIETKLNGATPDQFYKIFREQASLLRGICSDIVKDIQLADGTKTWKAAPGNRKWIHYSIAPSGNVMKVKDEVETVDDPTKTISFKVLTGAIRDNIIGFKLEVSDDNIARWTVAYTNAAPDDYLNLLESISKTVDNYYAQLN